MTSLMNTTAGECTDSAVTLDSDRNVYHYDGRHALKLKSKCNKVLKRKLKKYRLRRDGKEDQDVLDVSETLISILKIKSPNQNQCKEPKEVTTTTGSVTIASEKPTYKNYLSKMGRRKQNIKANNNTVIAIGEPIDMIQSTLSAPPPIESNVERKHTNAFKLLMDSRNKSIGGNSPGKEKVVDEFELQDTIEKKNIKAKRQLVLQKMADAKGATKKKEVEELRERIVKKKMEKRADKFKIMLLNKDSKHLEEKEEMTNDKNCCKNKGIKVSSGLHKNIQTDSNVNSIVIAKSKTLHPVDIFDLTKFPSNISPEKKLIHKEDEEFLKKLSPSLRKKENMLCYFKKVDKEPDQDENNLIIKVKLTTKTKKGKKKKLSLNKDIVDVQTQQVVEEQMVTSNETTAESISIDKKGNEIGRKRKRKVNTSGDFKPAANAEDLYPVVNNESRPKRNLRKPIKYSEDFLSSSDEELHIFTPKKKKHLESKTVIKLKHPAVKSDQEEDINKIIEKKKLKEVVEPKKQSKLAPIFSVKTQVDIGAIEAKQKFLQSGVPEKLKKIITQQKERNLGHNYFVPVVHVQQLNGKPPIEPIQNDFIPELFNEDENIRIKCEDNLFISLLDLAECKTINTQSSVIQNTSFLLKNMKQSFPKFPVYRTYHLLREKSRGEHTNNNYKDIDNSMELLKGEVELNNDSPDRLSWTDKFKATSSNHIIGNFESIKELKKWLEHWTENNIKSKASGNADSDSSDFYTSDVDSRDSLKSSNNLLIITGPVGSGKTSSVYAVATELAIKVIEVNASNKRTGKIMLQDLQEATQSHKVNRGNLGSDNSQKCPETIEIDLPQKKNRGRPKKIAEAMPKKTKAILKFEASCVTGLSQEAARTAMSLILIDDADIVFDQDDGFCSAIVQLVQSSKRPVILVTSTLRCPHLQRFIQGGKILKMNPLSPRVLGTWLDIMCLADNAICRPGIGAKILSYYQGDIRKTINSLQFYITTQTIGTLDEEPVTQSSEHFGSADMVDENSSMSWADRDVVQESIANTNDVDTIWKCFLDKQANLFQFRYPLRLFNLWWSLPCLLNLNNVTVANEECKSEIIKKLDSIANATDAISVSDYLRQHTSEMQFDITSEIWYTGECNSVSELENLDSFHPNCETIDEIAHSIVSTSIFMAQKTLESPPKTDIHFPDMDLQRERDRITSRHNSLTGFLNPSAILDRRSLALDYWSSCRTICRIEKCKTDTNSKRNNRFCHYLKSLNVLCKNDYFDNLSYSLSSGSKSDMI